MNTIIVTGSVRSGTSLLMRMLEFCGIPVVGDGHKQPDENNPHGYYETRQVYNINRGDFSVLNNAEGKVIKILPPTLIRHMPTNRIYKTIFMIRNPEEVGLSFYKYHKETAERRGNPLKQTQAEYLQHFIPDHIYRINTAKEWLQTHQNFDVLWVNHNELMNTPLSVTTQICNHISVDFPQYTYDPQALAALVDPNLYRHRIE